MSIKPCNDFRNVAVGDLVYCLKLGHGRIVEVLSWNAAYPVRVFFEDSDFSESYALDGRLETDDVTPMLYWGVPDIKSEASAPARYRNLNGVAVFESPIKDVAEVQHGMYVAASTVEEGCIQLRSIDANESRLLHWVRNGMVYPNTPQGKLWAEMHGKAFFGVGTPYAS